MHTMVALHASNLEHSTRLAKYPKRFTFTRSET